MAPNKTLYIRDEDGPVWERVELAARAAGQSVSQLVTASLRRYLESVESRRGSMKEIIVKVGPRVPPLHNQPASAADYGQAEAFTGVWLAPPGNDAQSRCTLQTTGYCYGVALTRRGQIAVYRYHPQALREATLEAYASLDDANLPDDIRDRASAALGTDRIAWRDI